MSGDGDSALGHLRVVELGLGPAAAYATRMLADLGADVIKLEPPRGDPTRLRGPRVESAGKLPVSSLFVALNAEKRSMLVDLDRDVTAGAVGELLAQADLFVTDAAEPVLERAGLDPQRLRDRFPRLVVLVLSSLSSEWSASGTSLHANAVSGYSSSIGDPRRDPIPLPFDVAELVAGVNGAAAALAALRASDATGTGEVVEVASGDVLFGFAATCSKLFGDAGERFFRGGRTSPGQGGSYPLSIFRCLDGFVVAIGRTQSDWDALRAMMGWPEWSKEPRFADAREVARLHAVDADAHVVPWFATLTRQQAFESSVEHNFPLAPVNTLDEVLANQQFRYRHLFVEPVEIGDRTLTWPRLPFRLSEHATPNEVGTLPLQPSPSAITFRHRAPQHERAHRPDRVKPLDDLVVLDLGWVWSAPMVSATLADLGAEVIKIEHSGRLDNARLRGRPVRDGVPVEGPISELSAYFHQNNRGKRSVTIDIKHPEGRDLLRDLMSVSDVVIENLSPGVFSSKGLGYDVLRQLNPGLIWMAMSSVGQSGPLSGMRTYAPTMTSLAGLESLVGYPDEPVMGLLTAGFGDPNSASHALFAVMSAICDRDAHGHGQFIDFAQVEASVAVLLEPLGELQMTGGLPATPGSSSPDVVPHGHYRCVDDTWIALSVSDDAVWQQVAALTGSHELLSDELSTAAGRIARRAIVDHELAHWTSSQGRDELVTTLAQLGATVTPVWRIEEAMGRSEFARFVHPVEHAYTGIEPLVATPWRFSRSTVDVAGPAPQVGEHTRDVLTRHLGLSSQTIGALTESGALN